MRCDAVFRPQAAHATVQGGCGFVVVIAFGWLRTIAKLNRNRHAAACCDAGSGWQAISDLCVIAGFNGNRRITTPRAEVDRNRHAVTS